MPQVTNLGAVLKQQAKLTSREIKDLSNMIYKHVLRIREERVDYFNEAGTPGSCPQPHHILVRGSGPSPGRLGSTMLVT